MEKSLETMRKNYDSFLKVVAIRVIFPFLVSGG